MSIRDILTIPDTRLQTIAEPVKVVDDDVRALLDDMLDTMYAAPGIGLAAPQIGVQKRVVVLDVSKSETHREPISLVNPEIVSVSDELSVYEEGCLSIPDYFEEVERPAECRVRFLDRDGSERKIDCAGLLATCIQHEVDHLNGILFIDYLSRLKRERITRKFAKARRRAVA